MTLHDVLANVIVKGAVTGAFAAAMVDLRIFFAWKSITEAKDYRWDVAAWRWFQGAVSGALAAAGYGAMVG